MVRTNCLQQTSLHVPLPLVGVKENVCSTCVPPLTRRVLGAHPCTMGQSSHFRLNTKLGSARFVFVVGLLSGVSRPAVKV